MVLFFSFGALAAALALSVVTFASTRSYLLSQRSEVAKRQAFNNAQLVRTLFAENPSDVDQLIANIRSERGGYAVLHLDATEFDSEFFYAQEPLKFTQSNLPSELVRKTLQGSTGRQRFTFNSEPYEAIGVSIPSVRAQYFEAFPLGDVATTLGTIQTTLLIGVILITIAAAILGLTTSRSVLRPLRRVTVAADEIATGGLDTRLDVETDPDLERLVTSFNDMADAVQSRIEREQRFASDVSHELRSPVTALGAAVAVLVSKRDEFSDRNKEAIDILSSQVKRFDRTVIDLLELSRLDAGASENNLESVHMGDLIKRIMSRYAFDGIPFVQSIPLRTGIGEVGNTGLPDDETLVDRRRIERILVNLLENARDHGGGAKLVNLGKNAEFFVLSVEDSGQGIALSERHRIFERFARGTAARMSTGSGLGLAIVQEHARALGGTAHVEDSPTGGAKFVVTIKRMASL
ncbi:MAG: sensor histidine kinase [Actinobacteria bacterium]|nr:MAG: sensor histidine kinase [Actinomycetota bacterium]